MIAAWLPTMETAAVVAALLAGGVGLLGIGLVVLVIGMIV